MKERDGEKKVGETVQERHRDKWMREIENSDRGRERIMKETEIRVREREQ